MKNSGIEWVGEIPDNWEVTKTKYQFQYKKEIAGLCCNKYERLALTMKNVVKRSKEDNTGLQPEKFETYQILRKDELVFKLIDLQNVSTSRVGRSPFVGIVSPAYIILRQYGKVLPCYAEKYFFVLWKNQIFNSLGDDGVRSNLGKDDLLNIPMPIPSLSEQKAIAEFLDKKCGEVDALIADIQQEIETLEQYKRSVITESVTKGLDPSVPMIDSGIDWVGIMPKHWKKMPNKYLMYKEKTICPVYNGESILSLTMKGVVVRDLEAGGKMPTSFDGYQQIKAGNLLMCLFDIDVTPRCIGLICNNGVTSPAYSQFIMKKMHTHPFTAIIILWLILRKNYCIWQRICAIRLMKNSLGQSWLLFHPLKSSNKLQIILTKSVKKSKKLLPTSNRKLKRSNRIKNL